MSMITDENGVFIKILPAHLSFGCVSQGYVYQLTVTVINKSSNPQSLKVSVTPSKGEKNWLKSNFVPKKIAPGTKQTFTIDFAAHEAGASNFNLSLEQSLNRVSTSRRVSALVVPLDVFKHVAKSLTLQKRPVYRNGVTVIGALGDADASKSIITASGASVLSEAMMDDADVGELMDLPLVDGIYFDHTTMELRVDEKLCEVHVGDFTLEDSIEKTLEKISERLDHLEDKGYHTLRSINYTGFGDGKNSPKMGSFVGRDSPATIEGMDLDAGSSVLGSLTLPAVDNCAAKV